MITKYKFHDLDIRSFKKLIKECLDIIFENSYDDVNFDPDDYEGNV